MLNLARIKNFFKSTETAYAHCDVPCGIYQPEIGREDSIEKANAIPRYVAQKEEHAKIAKETILGIWTDYFKPEHLQVYPELHEMVWKVGKLGSHVKQNVDLEMAKAFKSAIQDVERIFWETKK